MRRILCLLPPLLLAACATHPPVLPEHLPAQASAVELTGTPFFAQKRYQCGPASLAMTLRASDVEVTPAELVPKVYLPKRKGSIQAEMVAAAREYGRVPYQPAPNLDALLAELRAGRPALILENLGWDFYPVWHYAVVIGYNPSADQMILRSGTTRRKRVDADDFLDDWSKSGNWAMVLLRPGNLPAADDPHGYLEAAVGFEHTAAAVPAEAAYAAATQRWPEQGAGWLGLGNSRYAQGDLAGAETAYRALLERRPDSAIARNNLAQVLADRGCKTAAQRQIDRAQAHAADDIKPALEATRKAIEAAPAKAGASCPAP